MGSAGHLVPNQTLEIVSENEVMAVVDGQFGFGQVIGEEAMRIGLDKCAKFGVSLVALRNSGHLGRIGDWAEMAAREGKISLHFVNTSGGGILVAPYGGPSAGSPPTRSPPACRFQAARRSSWTCRPAPLPRGRSGSRPTRGPRFPRAASSTARATDRRPSGVLCLAPGAILPLGGHKGFALGVIVEVLAGASRAGSCSRPGTKSSPTTC